MVLPMLVPSDEVVQTKGDQGIILVLPNGETYLFFLETHDIGKQQTVRREIRLWLEAHLRSCESIK